MTTPGDEQRRLDEAFRAIVEHYGERPDLGTEEQQPAPAPAREPDPVEVDDVFDEPDDLVPDEEAFVPPPLAPIPRPTPRRAVAWGGIFVAPVLLLLVLVFDIDLPGVLDLLLLGWFVGGFVYLVATMPRTPREPWDDGSRI